MISESQITKVSFWIVGIVFCLFFSAFADELKMDLKNHGFAMTTAINRNNLFLSDHGSLPVEKKRIEPFWINRHEQKKIYQVNAVDSLEKGLTKISRYVFRYLFVSKPEEEHVPASVIDLASKIDTQKDHNKVFDLNLSFNIGCDEDSFFAVHAVKVSSYLLESHLDAVFHHKKGQYEVFFTNGYINNCLMDGMKLEFQVSPKKETGAVLVTMRF